MRCPYCESNRDRVVDSRTAEDGAAIRRRRECESCARRYTTFERAETPVLRVVKRSGVAEAFDRAKVVSGIEKACKNRPVPLEMVREIAAEVERDLRARGMPEVSTQEVGRAVLERLREVDEVAYMRFASVYRDFQELTDFEREVGRLLEKTTPPKGGARAAGR